MKRLKVKDNGPMHLAKLVLLTLLLLPLAQQAQARETGAPEKVRLQLKWLSGFQFAGYYMAKEKGFYTKAGLEVEILERQPGQNHIAQVVDGAADYGIADSALLLYRAQGLPVRAMASIFQHSPLIFITRGGADGIAVPQNLKGKRISYQSGPDTTPLLTILKDVGVTETDYTYVPLDFTAGAFIRGEVDAMSAYLSDQPFLMQQQGIPIHIINPLSYGIDFYSDILFSTDQVLAKFPDRSRRFLEASLRGWRYALEHPDETIDTLISHYHARNSREHLEYEAIVTRRLMDTDLVEIGYTSQTRLSQIAEIYQSFSGLDPARMVEALNTLIWDPHAQQKLNRYYLNLMIGLSCLVFLLVMAILLFNRHMQGVIAGKTRELTLQKQMVDKYVVISETNRQGTFTAVSEAFCRRTGYRETELLGQNQRLVRHPSTPEEFFQTLCHRLDTGSSWDGELQHVDRQGNSYWLHSHIEPLRDAQGRITGYRSISQDITSHKRLEQLSVTDALTGLANRMKLDERLGYELSQAERYRHDCSLILLDIDRFKQINDRFGHPVGDGVLKTLAQVLATQVRATDTVGRWGGEEFLIICPNTTQQDALECAEKLRLAIAGCDFGSVGRVTASLGVSAYRAGDTETGLLSRADQALYVAKSLGRNRVYGYRDGPDAAGQSM